MPDNEQRRYVLHFFNSDGSGGGVVPYIFSEGGKDIAEMVLDCVGANSEYKFIVVQDQAPNGD